MAQRIEIGLVLVLALTSFWAMAAAQSSSCTSVIVGMSPCLNYITGNSSTPSSGCCSQLASVVRSQPQCLCEVINGGGSSLGINVNKTQALALPGACNVQTPPLSRCSGAASPADSPAGSTDDSNTPSGTRSKTVPTTEDGTSAGSSTKLSVTLLFVALVAAYASSSATY